VAVLGTGSVAPGASALVQLVLQRPVGALHGDRFIVRDQSARRTLGGGVVIDAFPPRRGRARPERLGDLVAMESEEHDAALAELAERAKPGIDLAWFAANRNLTTNGTERLLARSGLKRAGKWAFSATVWADLRRGLAAALKGWHTQAVDGAGLPVARL
jgi:selenocysteine-specific elongation factor